MDNETNFIPVQPKEKKFLGTVKGAVKFPNHAMITLSRIKKKASKTLLLSPMAITALELTEESNYLGIARGFTDASKTKEALFVFVVDGPEFQFVSSKGNSIKMDSAKVNLNTRKAMSAKFHSIISNVHSDALGVDTKNFVLGARYGDKYWRLEEYVPTEEDMVEATEEDLVLENSEHVGETVEVTVD